MSQLEKLFLNKTPFSITAAIVAVVFALSLSGCGGGGGGGVGSKTPMDPMVTPGEGDNENGEFEPEWRSYSSTQQIARLENISDTILTTGFLHLDSETANMQFYESISGSQRLVNLFKEVGGIQTHTGIGINPENGTEVLQFNGFNTVEITRKNQGSSFSGCVSRPCPPVSVVESMSEESWTRRRKNVDTTDLVGWGDYSYFGTHYEYGSFGVWEFPFPSPPGSLPVETGEEYYAGGRSISIGQTSYSPPAQGSAQWTGYASGVAGSGRRMSGFWANAELNMNFSNMTVSVNIDEYTSEMALPAVQFNNVSVTRYGSFQFDDAQSGLYGSFYGPNHEEVGGAFSHSPSTTLHITGAFGARRTD